MKHESNHIDRGHCRFGVGVVAVNEVPYPAVARSVGNSRTRDLRHHCDFDSAFSGWHRAGDKLETMTPIERGYWRLRNITRMTRARRESNTLQTWGLALAALVVMVLVAAVSR